jgi:hypothetical protein
MKYDLTAHTAPILAVARTVGASLIAIAMMLVIWATATPAAAQNVCTSRTEVAKQLAGDHSETPVAAGLAASGEVVEVFSSNDGATWTIVLTRPGGISCLVATGEAWMNVPAKVVAKGPDV